MKISNLQKAKIVCVELGCSYYCDKISNGYSLKPYYITHKTKEKELHKKLSKLATKVNFIKTELRYGKYYLEHSRNKKTDEITYCRYLFEDKRK